MKTHKTPAYYRAPLTKRADIVSWLVDRATHENGRPGYGPFTFNVKCYDADLSFGNLVAVIGSEIPSDSIRYLAECRAKLQGMNNDDLWNEAAQDACENVTAGEISRMLWNGSAPIAKWEFAGRSGGWLTLTSFDGIKLAPHDGEYILTDPETPYRWLHRLYRFLVQCTHDFRREAVKREVEYKAAFNFFLNHCMDIPDDETYLVNAKTEQEKAVVLRKEAEDLLYQGIRNGESMVNLTEIQARTMAQVLQDDIENAGWKLIKI